MLELETKTMEQLHYALDGAIKQKNYLLENSNYGSPDGMEHIISSIRYEIKNRRKEKIKKINDSKKN